MLGYLDSRLLVTGRHRSWKSILSFSRPSVIVKMEVMLESVIISVHCREIAVSKGSLLRFALSI